MIVYADKRIGGTVGGGRFEHEVIERASAMVHDTSSSLLTLHLGAELGMCCGGRMEVLVSPLNSADSWLGSLKEALQKDKQIWLSTSLEEGSLGRRSLGSAEIPLSGGRRYSNCAVITNDDEQRLMVERVHHASRLILFGAGHVAQPTARMAQMLGYRVSVIDDRPDWNSEARFPDVSERILAPYEDVLFDFETLSDDALLIITRGHDYDQLILEALINEDVAYLGMIGSDTKVKKAVKKLEARKVNPSKIEKLHAPIGLSIGALTPQEIAVAIMAEIVATKRGTERGA
jgi:xanthine dehydrogenase accessory factor